MKCDELQYERLGDANKTYPASTLVIQKQFVDAAIAELKRENERLVKCCKEYDSRQRIDERIKFNGAQQLRATKRALWMHRAITAKHNKEGCKVMRSVNPFIGIQEYKWQEVERKCLNKAEKYK